MNYFKSKITKLKNSIISCLTDNNTADTAVIKTDISNIKSSNEYILKSIKGINLKIADLYAKVKELSDKGDRTMILETRINTINTQRTSKDEELKRDFTEINNIIVKINNKDEELSIRISNIEEYDGELDKRVVKIQNLITQDKLFEIRKNLETFVTMFEEKIGPSNKDLNDKHHNLKKLLFDQNDKFKLVKVLELEEVKKDSSGEIKKVDDKFNNLSIKVPFQFKVASIIATDKVENSGTTIKSYLDDNRLEIKDVSYDILSRVVNDDKFKSFKLLVVSNSYFYEENKNILIPKVGLKFLRAGTYFIEFNFEITIKKIVMLKIYSYILS